MSDVLAARPTRTVTRPRWVIFLVGVLALLAAQTVTAPHAAAATAPGPVTYQDQAYPAAGGPPSADKPQSKLWYNDGAWWGLLRSPSGPITIHRLANHVWTNTGAVVDDRAASTGDALWTGSKLYVASRVSNGALRVIRMSYNTTTDTYSMDAGFPKQVGSNGSESITIARDSAGKLWITFTHGSRVYVAHSTTSDTVWTAPYIIPTGDTTLSADDISAVIAFSGKIGVMYSDQQSGAMWFAVHNDGDSDQTWHTEAALSGPAIADDHINLKSIAQDPSGRIYAATKTSLGDNGGSATAPLIYVSTRAANGTWTSVVAGQVQDKLTRPQLAIDTINQMLYIVMASPDVGGGIVYYKRSPLGNPSFPTGKGAPFVSWSGVKLNNPSTTKDTVNATTGLVVLATDETGNRYYHGELSLEAPAGDTTPPSAPTGLTGTASSATSVALSWTASTDDLGVTSYAVSRNGRPVGTITGTTFTDTGLAAGTSYTYTVTASDAAGHVSPASAPVSVATQSSGSDGGTGSVTFIGSTTATGTTTSTTVASPAGVQAGDLMIAAVSTRGAPTITAPAGWTQVRVDSNGTTMRQAVFVHAATGTSEPSTWKLSSAQTSVVQVQAYRGIDTTNPVAGSAGVSSTGTAITSPAVTSAVTNSPVLTFAGTAANTALTPGSPLVERSEQSSGTTPTYKLSADIGQTIAGGTTAGPYTTTAVTGGGSVGQTVVLRAGSGGSTPPPAGDTTAPSVPTGVTATATSSTSVGVRWTASTDDVGVTGYRVYRNGTQVGAPAGTSYTDTTVAASTSYAYTVAAVDGTGHVSAQSSPPASVTTPGGTTATPPPPPAGTVTFVAAATATGTSASTAVASPAGVQARDVLVAAVSTRGAPTITAPAGWTQVRVDTNGTTMRQAVFVKIATSTDGSASFTLDKAQSTVVQVLAYRGVDTTNPVLASAGATSTTAAISSPAVAGANGSPVLTIAGIARTATLAPSSPLAERSEITTASAVAYKLTADSADTTASASTAGPYTTKANGSAGGIGQTVSLRPAA